MANEIRVPTLGESVTEATIAQWYKKPGDAVAMDEPLCELETDKVTIEVPAQSAGVLAEVVVNEGETVEVGALLGSIGEGAGTAVPAASEAAAAPAETPQAETASEAEKPQEPIGSCGFSASEAVSACGVSAGAAAASDAAGTAVPAPSPIEPKSAPTSTVSPSLTTTSANTPALCAGTSMVTLSVSNSHSGSSIATASPGFLYHCAIVASVTDSPNVGTRISLAIFFLHLAYLSTGSISAALSNASLCSKWRLIKPLAVEAEARRPA